MSSDKLLGTYLFTKVGVRTHSLIEVITYQITMAKKSGTKNGFPITKKAIIKAITTTDAAIFSIFIKRHLDFQFYLKNRSKKESIYQKNLIGGGIKFFKKLKPIFIKCPSNRIFKDI